MRCVVVFIHFQTIVPVECDISLLQYRPPLLLKILRL